MKKKKITIEGPVFPLLLIDGFCRAAYVTDKLREKKKIKKLKKSEIKSEEDPTRMLKNILENEKLRKNIIAITFILAFLGYLL
ncbi:MAG: hypothetical protein SOY60_05245 [Fusobacterium gastrosuis]|uniref:hypothetical protein n=1 Tax=Fusobacterium gastrosuis TaxID=1755100 RepID=UPI002971C983|nr:hypothetical protein [Fusobacteriaceae bacterium]MDY4011052.1 hypothetical protein [Fusobacterium gastrosuis]MDY5714116.1 hypothetical protein [Fusobacterium gastrosuis]